MHSEQSLCYLLNKNKTRQTDRQTDKTFILFSHDHVIQEILYLYMSAKSRRRIFKFDFMQIKKSVYYI